jgi:hypothetical protein
MGSDYKPRMIYVECGTVGGMRIGRGNKSTQRKPVPAPLYPPQNPYDDPRLNQGCCGGKPATNRLSYGATVDCDINYCDCGLPWFSTVLPGN